MTRRIVARSARVVQEAVARSARSLRRSPGAASDRSFEAARKLAAAAPARMLRLVRAARRLRGGSAFLAQAEALLTARLDGWAAAATPFADLRARAAPGAAAGLLRRRPTPAVALALPAARAGADLPEALAGRVVIYTTAFDDAPPPPPQFYDAPGLDRLCLTDRADLEIEGWRCLRVRPPRADPAEAAAWCMILPHEALAQAAPGAEASLYVAPELWLTGNLAALLSRWCDGRDVALWRHDAGVCWHDLAEAALIEGAAEREAILVQAASNAARGLPRDRGAFATGMIWRRHAKPGVAALMQAWWDERAQAPGLDAASLYAAVHDPGGAGRAEPEVLPAALGSAKSNIFAQTAPPQRRRAAGARRAGKISVSFAYSPLQANSATTELRARQLAAVIARTYPDRFEVSHGSDLAALRDRVVILIKDAIEETPPEALAALRRRNIAVISSWEDSVPDRARMAQMTANMTVSYRQTREHARDFPEVPSYLVGHHVNLLIPPSSPPADRLRTGYFGHLPNTHCPDSLRRMVDLVSLDTLTVDMSWIDRLPEYNCHWIVRRRKRADDGGKPFLKGFVAARCGAVVVVGRDDEDALQYLGDDYPFFVDATDDASLEFRMASIAAAFGGAQWRYAQAIMRQVAARSHDDVFSGEFRAMVEDVAA